MLNGEWAFYWEEFTFDAINGIGGGLFSPESDISREEAMTMITRAAKLAGMDTAVTPDKVTAALAQFKDGGSVSSWAAESAEFSISNGLIVGSNGLCRPKDSITRAEVATVVMRMLQKAGLIDSRVVA